MKVNPKRPSNWFGVTYSPYSAVQKLASRNIQICEFVSCGGLISCYPMARWLGKSAEYACSRDQEHRIPLYALDMIDAFCLSSGYPTLELLTNIIFIWMGLSQSFDLGFDFASLPFSPIGQEGCEGLRFMAPTIPIDYTGQRESTQFSKRRTGSMMGKTRKVSKGNSTGFVPDYRHAVETVAESEGFVISGRADVELAASEDPRAPNRKYISLNMDGFDRSVVPTQLFSLSMIPPFERRDLQIRFKSELDKVLKLQSKLASFSSNVLAHLPGNVVDTHQYGPKGHAVMETLPVSSGKKKLHPGRNGPRPKGGPVAANNRNELLKQQSFMKSTGFVMLMKQCDTLLTRLMGHQLAWIFNEPVDIVKHNIPDYFNVIKHPMDLGTVKSKLLSNQYSSPMDFAADVRLTFRNAMTYNPVGHTVHSMADAMSKYFETRWKSIEKKISSKADESAPAKSSVIMETESAYLPPVKKQKTTSTESSVRHETEKRVMSDDERQKLGTDLEEYLAELPDNIVSFLKESTSNSSQVSEDEIEIELSSLGDEILFKLRKLLDDFLMERQKKQPETSKIEMQKESGFDSSSNQPCQVYEPADEDVDIGIDVAPPASSYLLIKTDADAARSNNKCSSSRNSDTEADSGHSACEIDDDKKSVLATSSNGIVDAVVKEHRQLREDLNSGDSLNGNADERNTASNPSSSIEPHYNPEGEGAPQERQVSPDKLYRAALLRSRFADIILKAQEIEKGEGPDPDKLKLDKEELERRRKEEKARLQAEAKAAEEARKKAEAEAAAEAKRKRELEREAAREALLKMEKTVEINECSQFMEDLEMFRSGQDEPLQSFIEAASPENSQNGLGSFKFPASSNPLEQLGLYMKNDDDEEEEIEPHSNLDASNDPEEGEID
ncbi:bromodomain-containing protein [Striga asiatica]|uniref:Bromodomain-containing protein n=1 Tax=Striga asiatica TaxID=4170 RepID=A0A5A7QUF8_STRAF|nr:bromodomain-containing protein [Striga asiatica]